MFHIHIYKVSGKIEFDIDKEDRKEALAEAMKMGSKIKGENFGESDCEYLAITVEEEK